MSEPKRGDLLIRTQTDSAPPTFVVVDAITRRQVSGPFSTIPEAATSAAELAGTRRNIWQENVDHRGRSLGPPLRFPLERV